MSIFVGIDLAAEPANTGLVVLYGNEVVGARNNVTDQLIIEHIHKADKAGVDVPIGWPQPFVEHVRRHAAGQKVGTDSSISWRRQMAMRETDQEVHRLTGVRPMSVSTDRIAYPALRWSVIASQLEVGTARDGSQVVAEVYPAAALKQWGLPHRGYKKDSAARASILESLPIHAGEHVETIAGDDNILDALIAALVAREIPSGGTAWPAQDQRELALVEGWIHVPHAL